MLCKQVGVLIILYEAAVRTDSQCAFWPNTNYLRGHRQRKQESGGLMTVRDAVENIHEPKINNENLLTRLRGTTSLW